jgi:hypothetical protein
VFRKNMDTISLSCKQSFVYSQLFSDNTLKNQNCTDCNSQDSKKKLKSDSYQIKTPNGDNISRYLCLQCLVEDIEQTLRTTIDISCETNANSFISFFTKSDTFI